MHGQFAGPRNEQIALDADEVAVIEQTEKVPTVDFATGRVVAHSHDVLAANVNLQTGSAIRQMDESGLAHHARRRGDAPGHTHLSFIKLSIRSLEVVR